MIRAAITGVAAYAPEDILSNDDLAKMVDTSDEWIMTRVGIKERRILKDKNKGTSFMGIKAVNELLRKTNTKPTEIDAVVFATTTPDYPVPATVASLAVECGLVNAMGFDVNAACSGFLYGLEVGSNFIKSGNYKKIIVVAGDKLSSITNYKDRTTCPLFGDAVGAVLLEPTTEDYGIMDSSLFLDGSGISNLNVMGGGSACPASHETVDKNMHYLYQEGQTVFKHAVSKMVNVSRDIMKRNNLTIEDISWLVPHQANIRIIEAVGSRLEVPEEKVMINIQKYGNSSSGTIPLCLAEWEPKLKKGDNLILTAFGGGFTWGAIYIKWAY